MISSNHKDLYIQTIYTDFSLKLKILQDSVEHIQDISFKSQDYALFTVAY